MPTHISIFTRKSNSLLLAAAALSLTMAASCELPPSDGGIGFEYTGPRCDRCRMNFYEDFIILRRRLFDFFQLKNFGRPISFACKYFRTSLLLKVAPVRSAFFSQKSPFVQAGATIQT
jgi:hypothetical protein